MLTKQEHYREPDSISPRQGPAGLTCVLETRELTLGTRVDCDALLKMLMPL